MHQAEAFLALTLFLHGGCSYEQIGSVLDVTVESVRSMLSQELEGETNIRVNSVNPGRMRTAMRAAAYPAEDPNTVPPPACVSGPFLYLLSGQSRAIDGQYIEAQ